MANLIDDTYFIDEIYLPNTSDETILSELTSFITKCQEEVLISILGYELYKLYIANTGTGVYKDITDGAEFTFDIDGHTVTRKWIGLVNTELESLIAYYTYFYYVKNRVSFTGGIGELFPNSENSSRMTPRDKMVTAWNRYITLTGVTCKDYVKYDTSSYEHINDEGSLFNFLLANLSDYPTWQFKLNNKINVFDF